MGREIDYSPLREWANGYSHAEGDDQLRRAMVCSLLAENERLRFALDDARPDRMEMVQEIRRLRNALVEIDTYLANDPQVWRLVSVAKVGEVLCEILGFEVIQRINAVGRDSAT